ncbi:DUF305 domain-containing protein [Spirillospora sp. NPDC050679]
MRHRIAGTALAALAAAGLLGGCGEDGPKDARPAPTATVLQPGRPGEPNKVVTVGPTRSQAPTEAEVRFVRMMIPHHEQAQAMSVLAPGQAADPGVKSMAARIDAAQGVEISAMQSWLRTRAGGAAKGGPSGHAGHGAPAATATATAQDEHANMPGMATPQQMEQLRAARGAAFDRLYLELMITHHQGALTMVKEVLDRGTDPVVQELARDVQSGQLAEIGRMRALQRG